MNMSSLLLRSNIIIITRTKTTQKSDVLFETLNKAGIVILNRPKQLNCLTTSMISEIMLKLQEWEKTKCMIIMKGAGDKAFCAGGDAKIFVDRVRGYELYWNIFNLIYNLNNCRIPCISLNDGYSIGGGLAMSLSGKYGIATEKTQMSMPEIKIGLAPALAATYIFPRLKFKIGYYLGLTGETLRGNDTVQAGVATHLVPSERLQDFEYNISKCTDEAQMNAVLNKCCEKSVNFSLAPFVKDIEYCFSALTLDQIINRLEATNNEWSMKTLKSLSRLSPGLLKVTLRAFQASAKMDYKECLMMEHRIICRATANHDFPEGVRALLLDKDNNPRWNPRTLSEVTTSHVDYFFKKLPHGKELTFHTW